MARLTVLYWRDIPAQVIARQGRESIKRPLSPRFQQAIDRAAMRAGKGESQAYLDEWRREAIASKGAPASAADAAAAALEAAYDDARLERLIKAGGVEASD